MNETNKKNLLETIIEDIPNTKSTVFFPPNLNPHVNENYFDIARRAVEVIESPGEIQQFVKEFVQHIQIKYSLDEKIAKQEMNKTIGYCTGYVDDDQANIWFYALPDIKHPITGRERPFNKAKNSQGYLLTIETGTEKIKKYVLEEVEKDILGAEAIIGLNVQQLKQDDDNLLAFHLTPEKKSIADTMSSKYMFLSGYILGFSHRINLEFGEELKISFDYIPAKNELVN